MGRLTQAWAVDKPLSRKERRAASGRAKKLAKLIKIQASEMRHEHLNRLWGD